MLKNPGDQMCFPHKTELTAEECWMPTSIADSDKKKKTNQNKQKQTSKRPPYTRF